jgi:hypothetical protein
VSEHREDDDVAWLLARAKGKPGPSISPARATSYEKLEAMITRLPARQGDAVPPADWQDRVLAAIDERSASRGRNERSKSRGRNERSESRGRGPAGEVSRRRRKAWLLCIVGAAAVAALVWAITAL